MSNPEELAPDVCTALERPIRVQLSRAEGWKMPPNTVKVDRSTQWGNPFSVTRLSAFRWELNHPAWPGGLVYATKSAATDWAVTRFACEAAPLWDVSALRGKNLACWCGPDEICHADVLLDMAAELSSAEQTAGNSPGISSNNPTQ